ncbi:glucose-6-phosphate dehydrogenase [Bacterioplanes sanyensis]|uniref:Glucose-6-phosphate 1-dehydrogenase n=1 Tax=Bacterioplanes sanyensis TaxID=1249553 RepID=A0A222FKA8_9GAMM|nr:glucose-6-phosphate dehydrogenase [Bacterioplanes sanyensis]ASP39477.1 glucose-6-phosphate dehydrogenase [Bacterioplanes sanyensis]
MQIHSPFDLVLFGGLGDLARRKLLPALYMLDLDQRLPDGHIVLISRRQMAADELQEQLRQQVQPHLPPTAYDVSSWQRFTQRVRLQTLDAGDAASYQHLVAQLSGGDNRVFYLATGSDLYTQISQGLYAAGLITPNSKVVLEKPIGHDLSSANAINTAVAEFFDESQIYRIDHYLGKETVQNLMVLRFANSLFEHQWNHKYIDHIQISITESLGVESRAGFYDHVGATRDMFQNHLLQLLCITAMEPPARLEPDAVRDEKVKVLRALRPVSGAAIGDHLVRGQYDAGVSAGRPVPGYREEPGIAAHSYTETFVAAKVHIDNWRWAGVPFYLRTGKRLAERACEIVVHFKEIPHSIFPLQHKSTMANKLVFRLQPDEGIRLMLCEKKVGPGMSVRPMNLSLNPANLKQTRVPEAYERLLFDVLSGNATLFLRNDELTEAWRWIDPVLRSWKELEQRPEPYTAGSWGPAAATLLLAKDGRLWDESS